MANNETIRLVDRVGEYVGSNWVKKLKYQYPDKKRKPKQTEGIIDKYMEFDDGTNAYGFIAYRWPSGVIVKYHFHYYTGAKAVRLYRNVHSDQTNIYRRKQVSGTDIKNKIIGWEVYKLLNRENVVSDKELKRIFAKFE